MSFWINLIRGNYILAGGDHTYWLDLRGFFLKKIYAWQNFASPGEPNHTIPESIISLVFSLSDRLNISYGNFQIIFLFLLLSLSGVAFVLLLKEIEQTFKLNKTMYPALLIGAIFYVLNPFNFNILQIEKILQSIALPICLYFLFLGNRKNNILYLVVGAAFTALLSPMSINLAVFVAVFIFLFIHSLSAGIAKREKMSHLFSFLIFSLFSILFNLWWILPTLTSLLTSSNESISFLRSTNFINSVWLHDLIRMITSWAWNSGHRDVPYVAFAERYNSGILLFVSFALSGIPLIFALSKIRGKYNLVYLYSLIVILITLFLAKGATPPFGYIYSTIFSKIPLFSMFREPSAKFMQAYFLQISLLLSLFVNYLLSLNLQTKYKRALVSVVLLAVLINAGPILSGEIIWDKWNGSMRSLVTRIPYYWEDFRQSQAISNDQGTIVVYPGSGYGATYNWREGFNGTDVTKFFTNNQVLSYYTFPIDSKSKSVNLMFPKATQSELPKNLFGLFNIKYLLQTNDSDWRYSGLPGYTVTSTNRFIGKTPFTEINRWGNFDERYLDRLENREKDYAKRNELYIELINEPALKLHQIQEDRFVPKFFAPEITVNAGLDSIPGAIGLNQNINRQAVIDKKDFPDSPETNFTFLTSNPTLSENKENQSWNIGWSWPTVSISPEDFRYRLINIKELARFWTTKDPLSTADIHIWHGAKRIAEIESYVLSENTEKILLKEYMNQMRAAITILQNIPHEERNKTYYRMTSKLLGYINKSNDAISKISDPPLSKLDISDLEDLLEQAENEANTRCKMVCYKFDLAEDGVYSIYLYRHELEQLPVNDAQITLEIEGLQITKTISELLEQDSNSYLIKISEVSLSNDLHYINSNINSIGTDLIIKGDLAPQTIDIIKDNLDIHVQNFSIPLLKKLQTSRPSENHEMPFPLNIKERKISEWKPNQKYVISFDYEINKSYVGASVMENIEITDNLELNNLNIRETRREAFGVILDENNIEEPECAYKEADICFSNYSQEFTSGNLRSTASVYIYTYTENNWGTAKIRNLQIREKHEPRLALAKENFKPVTTNPDIIFSKVNPTKYKVDIRNINDNFLLVFSETYHPRWVIHKQESDNFFTNLLLSIKPIGKHTRVNGYANAWYLSPEDLGNQKNIELTVEYLPQRLIAIGALSGIITAVLLTPILLTLSKLFNSRLKKSSILTLTNPLRDSFEKVQKPFNRLINDLSGKKYRSLVIGMLMILAIYNLFDFTSGIINELSIVLVTCLIILTIMKQNHVGKFLPQVTISLVVLFPILISLHLKTATAINAILIFILMLIIVCKEIWRIYKSDA